jgi:iron complex transport system substrate-binding protein
VLIAAGHAPVFLSAAKAAKRAIMTRCAPFSRLIALAAAAFAAVAAEAAPPTRVASLNQCTDQLLAYLAAPGQIASLSFVIRQPQWTPPALAETVARAGVNHGRAEEMALQKPDLIVTSLYSDRATVALLRRLGYRVEEFAPENSLADIRGNVLRMGALIGAEARAHAIVAAFDRQLEDLRARRPAGRRVLADIGVGGFTPGSGTLNADIAELAGFELLGDRLGIAGFGHVSAEATIMARPDRVAFSNAWGRPPSLATEALRHPAMRAMAEGREIAIPDRLLICGAPHSLEAAERLLRAP